MEGQTSFGTWAFMLAVCAINGQPSGNCYGPQGGLFSIQSDPKIDQSAIPSHRSGATCGKAVTVGTVSLATTTNAISPKSENFDIGKWQVFLYCDSLVWTFQNLRMPETQF